MKQKKRRVRQKFLYRKLNNPLNNLYSQLASNPPNHCSKKQKSMNRCQPAFNCNALRLRKLRVGCSASFAVCHIACIPLRNSASATFRSAFLSLVHCRLFAANRFLLQDMVPPPTPTNKTQRHTYLSAKAIPCYHSFVHSLRRLHSSKLWQSLQKKWNQALRIPENYYFVTITKASILTERNTPLSFDPITFYLEKYFVQNEGRLHQLFESLYAEILTPFKISMQTS